MGWCPAGVDPGTILRLGWGKLSGRYTDDLRAIATNPDEDVALLIGALAQPHDEVVLTQDAVELLADGVAHRLAALAVAADPGQGLRQRPRPGPGPEDLVIAAFQ